MNTIIPRKEHPNPQKYRKTWMNLNGEWDFEFDFGNSGKEKKWFVNYDFNKKIIVPFCPESKLSGIEYKDFMEAVWYKKEINLSEEQLKGKVLLHFGAVDYHCEVWVNEKWCGEHNGGYTSFEFDITDKLEVGTNQVVVYAKDDIRSRKQPSGKQCMHYHSWECYYTRTTGIWQTVWLEFVPDTYIKNFKVTTDRKNKKACFKIYTTAQTEDVKINVEVSYQGKSVATCEHYITGQYTELEIKIDEIHLWDIGQGNLYNVKMQLMKEYQVIDEVETYFGIRDIEWKDQAMYLNGRPVYQRLVLDQGFYPEGIYTAPTDDDFKKDIQIAMNLGFNGARLHEKVFEKRYIYWADQMGYLVWGEHANWGLNISSGEGLKNFLAEWIEAVERDFNHPSIVGWCPFNETWDEPNGARQDNEVLRTTYLVTKQLDPTRPVIDTSGNYHVVTDIYDVHNYEQNPIQFAQQFEPMINGGEVYDNYAKRQTYKGEPYFVSEYGGTWWKAPINQEDEACEGTSRETSWGYGNRPRTEEEVIERYVGLTKVLLENPKICGFCYTQIYDVEQEENGLYTYDRKPKFREESYNKIRKTNTQVAAIENK